MRENTLEAFRNGLNAGATHIETDVHATLDGIPVLVHDPVVEGIEIAKTLFSELPTYIPTLQEALETFPLTKFNIDVKSKTASSGIARVVNDLEAHNRVLITSFSERRRKITLKQTPGAATSASALSYVLSLITARLGIVSLTKKILHNIDALQIPTKSLGINAANPKMISRFHEASVFVYFWTINDPVEMKKLLDMGVDGLVTDRSDLARKVIDSRDDSL